MKKTIFTFIVICLMTACGKSPSVTSHESISESISENDISTEVVDEVVRTYKNATRLVRKAVDNNVIDQIHDHLLEDLYRIGKRNKESLPDIRMSVEVKEAYNNWMTALKECTTEDHWMFMTFCTIDAAMEGAGN